MSFSTKNFAKLKYRNNYLQIQKNSPKNSMANKIELKEPKINIKNTYKHQL